MALIVALRRTDPLSPGRETYDYEVDVEVTARKPGQLETRLVPIGERVVVTGHRYDDGWAVLVAKFLQQHHPQALEAVMAKPRKKRRTRFAYDTARSQTTGS